MVNLIDGGMTPVLPLAELQALGFHLATWPLTLLSAAMQAMTDALAALGGAGEMPPAMPFAQVQRRLGFADYYTDLARYEDPV
jgi:2-methylisocitrate lyase-like PEP mutase family enzyme